MPTKPPTHKPSFWRPPAEARKERDFAYNHGKRKQDAVLAERQRLRNTARWQTVRGIVMRRDLRLCQECRRNQRTTPATEVHHIDQDLGLFYDMDNLEAICRRCHNAESARERKA